MHRTHTLVLALPFALATIGASAADFSAHPAAQRARMFLQQDPGKARAAVADTFVARDVIVDRNGSEHVRFDRVHQGLRVIGGDLVVHSRSGTLRSIDGTLPGPVGISTRARLGATDAIARARAQFAKPTTAAPASQLVVFAHRRAPALAWEVQLAGKRSDGTPTRMRYYLDANDGSVLASWDMVHTGQLPTPGSTGTSAVGSGQSLYSGVLPVDTIRNSRGMYEMKDALRGGTHVLDFGDTWRDASATRLFDGNNLWGNGQRSDRATVAVDAQWGIARTWDFFKEKFGRLGVGNDGVGTTTIVHFEKDYANAFWLDDCKPLGANGCMVFGDGQPGKVNPLMMLDVAGHEMSHGVTSRTANLVYAGASGGLNEATSDIFGAMVEFFANHPGNPPNYLMGEKLFADNPDGTKALRTMFKPSLDGVSRDCYPAFDPRPGYEDFFNNYMDPHYSSGPANHFFYLLAEGAVVPAKFDVAPYNLTPADLVCNGNTALTAIGREAAMQIWYRALTVYMTSSSYYPEARAATLSAAADLYGAGSTQHKAVAAAWSAVDLN